MPDTNSDTPTDEGIGDAHVCGKCRGEFIELSEFLTHKKTCTRKRLVYIVADETDDFRPLENMDSPDYQSGASSDDLSEEQELTQKQSDDIMNSDGLYYEKVDSPDSGDLPSLVMNKGQSSVCMDDLTGELDKTLDGVLNLSNSCKNTLNRNLINYSTSLITNLPQSLLYSQYLPETNVTLETLQNTKVAVAQHSSTSNKNQTAELAALQSALYTLQQQQLIQLQIIQQLQSQLIGGPGSHPPVTAPLPPLTRSVTLTSPLSSDTTSMVSTTATTTSLLFQQTPSVHVATKPGSLDASSLNVCSSASDVTIQAKDSLQHPLIPPPPLPHEPNTLELLQRHTEQALQNTMSGGSFLLNGVNSYGSETELSKIRKGKLSNAPASDGKSLHGQDDSFFRHRCRFCGKVFGSDSALQIHIRSHTGERPFRCNICGNRFSTKGNLKVHFQRHKSKYPHIEMDSNPFPEHLDKLYPPLEPPSSQSPVLQEMSNSCSSQPPLLVPQIASLPQSQQVVNGEHRQALASIDLENRPTTSQEEELSNEEKSDSAQKNSNLPVSADEVIEQPETDMPLEKDEEMRNEQDQEDINPNRILSPEPSTSQSPIVGDEEKNAAEIKGHEELNNSPFHSGIVSVPPSIIPPYPPFLSTMAASYPTLFHPSFSPALPSFNLHSLTTTSTTQTSTPTATTSDDHNNTNDPVFYQDLLPKPGSTDSNWESLMEITKTSETTKLQQLVDNIEHKLSDPNQCVICHRVLSCRSALQMHYRTHTGERPFKCKICGRAFTTKGNLKTHMGVHRVKPPLRVLHQCPVCHKQFTNSLVLQQHIRMHTGEPIDMSPEQIMANEIRTPVSLPTPFPRPILPALPLNFSTQSHFPQSVQTSLPLSQSHPSTPSSSPGISTTLSSLSTITKNTDSVIKAITPPAKDQDDFKDNSKEELSEDDGLSQTDILPIKPLVEDITKVIPDVDSVTSACASTSISISSSTSLLPLSLISDRPLTSSITHTSSSLTALENHTKSISTSIPQPLFAPFGMGIPLGYFPRFENTSVYLPRSQTSIETTINNGKPLVLAPPFSPNSTTSKATSDNSGDERSTPGSVRKSESPSSVSTPISSSTTVSSSVITSVNHDSGALDLTPKASMLSTNTPPSPSEMAAHMFAAPLGGLPFASHPGRMNTTCQICFKTFACQSALSIHYRSHTKERPFKCDACDRAFSTKGNMKQHMLTHKIKDLPSQLFTTSPTPTTTTSNSSSKTTSTNLVSNTTTASSGPKTSSHSHKRPISENSASVVQPLPKRPQGIPKHMCNVCHKPFSSASALQIHMRTHTGDKPFKCTVCERAFTTKGNLKVHMGTHMWNNCTSRRGRRMSIDLPSLQMTPPLKPGDFQPPRPELYFPYLPPAYMNGMTTPKMNEISVIQSAGMTNGNMPSSLNMFSHQGLARNIPRHPVVNSNSASVNDTPSSGTINGLKMVNESEKNKSQSPQAPRDLSSPGHPTIQHSPPAGDRPPTWGWKMACNICNKICASSTEVENHIKSHFKPDLNEEDTSTTTAENLAA
ncbi:sal-like protein 1 isoform X2 [Limulus polyphemus]|uniref:Sal-like protein 1 isoform X2 n=1 Tax=Limulus polyphemus TaxID=6850 RepID=A0ABM1S2K8_LIMPO|nr:sal-like protein 1 isoform X2 [Limulus polyphemus]